MGKTLFVKVQFSPIDMMIFFSFFNGDLVLVMVKTFITKFKHYKTWFPTFIQTCKIIFMAIF